MKVIKRAAGFEFTNPGILKLSIEDIYRGGNSKSRNPRMQTILRMIGFGGNAGSGFPAILSAWENEGWIKPELEEDTRLNQVALVLKLTPNNGELTHMDPKSAETLKKLAEKSTESAKSKINLKELSK